ncbi:MAG: hypothetical protein KGI04_03750 [Candidatus Micrarchaeota archaeon]|nr:hypothetical protein [Candidatus Micrarchaeota archaeon]
MKAQLSLELLLYAALAGLSLLFALGAVGEAGGRLGESVASFQISQLVYALNSAMLNGGQSSGSFYLPAGLCGATISGDVLHDYGHDFYLSSAANASPGLFCPDGVQATLTLSIVNGAYRISRGA